MSALIVFVALKRSVDIKFKINKFLLKPILATMGMIICAWNIYGYLINEISSVSISFLISMIFRRNYIWIVNYSTKSFF